MDVLIYWIIVTSQLKNKLNRNTLTLNAIISTKTTATCLYLRPEKKVLTRAIKSASK